MNYRNTGSIGCSLICFVLLHYRAHQSRTENQVWLFIFRQDFTQFGILLVAFSISKSECLNSAVMTTLFDLAIAA